MMAFPLAYPREERDQRDQAEEYYAHPIRVQNRNLIEENMHLKRLLHENGISWSSPVSSQEGQCGITGHVTSPTINTDPGERPMMPYLPTEVQLRILRYAMISEYPIIDPLSKKTSPFNMTRLEAKRKKSSQIAIGFLATCKAFNFEGSRILWANNTFVFTTHVALRNFSNLSLKYRQGIKRVTLRIIAQFYDDQKRNHILSQEYHPEMKKDLQLRVQQRPKEDDFTRRGFRCYAWTQAVDFFNALRPPYDPDQDSKKLAPRLLPNLEAMRIDFVNFPGYFMPAPGHEFHVAASHHLAATLNELMITGISCCESGMKAGLELSGMVKQDGLFMDGIPAFRQGSSNLQPLGGGFDAKVMRAWDCLTQADLVGGGHGNADIGHEHHAHPAKPICPEEIGHPESTHETEEQTTWKRVPVTRDSEEREWIEFGYICGMPADLVTAMGEGDYLDLDEDKIPKCVKCGENNHAFEYYRFMD